MKDDNAGGSDAPTGIIDAPAEVALFGYEPKSATLHLRPRSRSWRVGGAVRTGILTLVFALPVAIIPPHAPWVIGVLVGGGFLTRRRLHERFTVVGIDGTCPRCGGTLEAPGGRLKNPHPVLCRECHYEGGVATDPTSLEKQAAAQV